METIEEVVQAGVEAQAQIDRYLAKAYAHAKKLTEATEKGVELGMVQGIAAKSIIGRARHLQGAIGALAADFALLHREQTDACIDAGVDLGSVTTAGGITIGGVSTQGGGGR